MSSEEVWLTVNLSETKNTSPDKRTKKAIKLLKYKVAKAWKSKLDDVRISTALNDWIWKRGKNFRYSHLKVKISKEDEKLIVKTPDESPQVNSQKDQSTTKNDQTEKINKTES